MKRATITRWLTWLAWFILVVSLVLVFVTSLLTTTNQLFLLIYLIWLMFVPPPATMWIVYVHRAFFRTWPGWGATALLLTVSLYIVMQNIIPIESPFALLFVLLALNSIFVAPMATAILLWYRDVGLLFLASLPVTFVWTGVLSWYIQGDLLESIVTTLNDPFSPSPLWWLYSFWCIYSCGLPLALLSLIIHTGRYLWREYKGNDEVTLASLSIKVGE